MIPCHLLDVASVSGDPAQGRLTFGTVQPQQVPAFAQPNVWPARRHAASVHCDVLNWCCPLDTGRRAILLHLGRPRGLAHERTALAGNRSRLAVVVCIAVLLRHLWSLQGTGQYVALGGTDAAAIVWAVTVLVCSVSGAGRGEQVPRGAKVFGLMTVGTVMLAVVAWALAFFQQAVRGKAHGPLVDAGPTTRVTQNRGEKRALRSRRCSDTLGGMCRAVTCRKCGRPSWKGCGAHVEQVLGHVPRSERCQCGSEKIPPAQTNAKRKSWFSRLSATR
jgi:hypothetical protein